MTTATKPKKINAETTTARAIIYARQSSGAESDDKSASIQNQIADCKALAEANGYAIAAIYSDANTSGRTYPEGHPLAALDAAYQSYCREHVSRNKTTRQGLSQALQDLSQGKADTIIIYDRTRLCRPVAGSYLGDAIGQALGNIKVHSVTEGLQSSDVNNKLVTTVTDIIADDQLSKTLAKARTGQMTARDSGMLYCNPKAYGLKGCGRGKAEWVPSETEIVLKVYELLESGLTMCGIATALDDGGYTTRNGSKWSLDRVSTIRKMIERPIYAGMQTNSKGELIPCQWIDPLIPYERWQSAQTLLPTRRKPAKGKAHIRPLTSLMVCECGCKPKLQAVSAKGRARTMAYYCPECGNRAQVTDSVYGEGLETACAGLTTAGLIQAMITASAQPEHQAKLQQIEVALAGLKKSESEKLELRNADLISFDGLKAELEKMRDKRKALESEAKNIREKMKSASHIPNGYDLGYELQKLQPHEYRTRIAEVVSSLTMQADRSILVTMCDGRTWTLPSHTVRTSKVYPHSEILANRELTAESQITITYSAPDIASAVVYEGQGLIICTQPL